MRRPMENDHSAAALRELVAIFCLTFLTWYIADLSTRFADKYFVISLLLALVLIGVSIRLWSNLQRERNLRKQAEQLLLVNRATLAAAAPIDRPATAAASAVAPNVLLTEREREVLSLIASSCSNQQIATALHISLNTVERHSANVYRKLGVRGRVEATAYALRNGLVTEASLQRCTDQRFSESDDSL